MVTMATLSRNFFTVSFFSLIFAKKEEKSIMTGQFFEGEESFNEQKNFRSEDSL